MSKMSLLFIRKFSNCYSIVSVAILFHRGEVLGWDIPQEAAMINGSRLRLSLCLVYNMGRWSVILTLTR